MRRAGVLVGIVLALTSTPALASTGVSVGPARQLVPPEERIATVYVVNTGTRTVEVRASEWAHAAGGWARSDVGLAFAPERFELQPGEQRDILVSVPRATDTACRLVGAGFAVRVRSTDAVVVRGVGLAQLALQGRGGTEADCLAILPEPPAPLESAQKVPWLVVGVIIVALALFLSGRATKRGGKMRLMDLFPPHLP